MLCLYDVDKKTGGGVDAGFIHALTHQQWGLLLAASLPESRMNGERLGRRGTRDRFWGNRLTNEPSLGAIR